MVSASLRTRIKLGRESRYSRTTGVLDKELRGTLLLFLPFVGICHVHEARTSQRPVLGQYRKVDAILLLSVGVVARKVSCPECRPRREGISNAGN
jgi:hypothetical protein